MNTILWAISMISAGLYGGFMLIWVAWLTGWFGPMPERMGLASLGMAVASLVLVAVTRRGE
jgi:hypothetical protein